ncbi:MAG TPA: EAL domain-containing protein [Gammaproteobacteria bacterium]|nr:EAL domain-containing protein [Gammaproteobacteria bacterium]
MPLFLPIVWIIAGFTLAAGVWCISGNIRAQHTAFLSFGVLAILIAADLALTAEYYSLDSLTLMKMVYDLRNILICIIFPVAVWFIGTYTRVRKLSSWVATCGVIYAGFLIAYLWSGGDWFITDWVMEPSFVFFGEKLSWANNAAGPLFVYFSSTHDAVFVWALWRCAAMWYAGLNYKALPLTTYFLLQAAAVVSDQLMSTKHEPYIQLGQFAFLGLVVIMGVSLILETRRREEAFYKTVGALQAETAKRKRYEARLNYLATHDPLTDLPNRRQLRTILDTTLQQYQTSGDLGAIVFLDLDHFKTINDSLGHQVGDKLLRLIAERLRNALPETRCVSRLGGDEFAVVIGNLGRDRTQAEAAAMRAADTLRDKLGEPFAVNGQQFSVGGSVGVSVFPEAQSSDEQADVGALFRQADMALYRAKATGRNRAALFATQMQQDARLRLVIEEGLRTVLDRGELELYFQPQMDFQGQLIGAEALLRWNHPRYGLIEPQQFIPVAEETGLIHDIGEFVLTSACRYLREWNGGTLATPPRLAINVSPWQLATPGFARKVKRSLARSGIDPACLTLEITESAVLQDIAEVTRTILELSALGVRFSIDDFGSGYAALASLKKLPLHELKIDRMFVSEMRLDLPDQFIRTIITMAENMGLYVIAEGVETEAQRSALVLLGCPGFQGYLISKPMNARTFMDWLSKMPANGPSQPIPELRIS